METPRRARRHRSAVAFIVVLIAGLALVWPARLGGSSTFVIVKGTSMEPTFHSGDLLYARSASSYRVGDVVVYRVPKRGAGAGEMIVHRIRARTSDGRYVMQGDNRREDDGAFPTGRDFVARPIVDLGPLPATMLILLPWLMMLLCAVVIGWYLWPSASGTPQPAARPVVAPLPRPARRVSTNAIVTSRSASAILGARNVSAVFLVVIAFSGLVVLRQVGPDHGIGNLGSSQIAVPAVPAGEITFSTGIDFSVQP